MTKELKRKRDALTAKFNADIKKINKKLLDSINAINAEERGIRDTYTNKLFALNEKIMKARMNNNSKNNSNNTSNNDSNNDSSNDISDVFSSDNETESDNNEHNNTSTDDEETFESDNDNITNINSNDNSNTSDDNEYTIRGTTNNVSKRTKQSKNISSKIGQTITFKCKKCSDKFKDKKSFKRHKINCTIKCIVCSKTFDTKEKLERHKIKHVTLA